MRSSVVFAVLLLGRATAQIKIPQVSQNHPFVMNILIAYLLMLNPQGHCTTQDLYVLYSGPQPRITYSPGSVGWPFLKCEVKSKINTPFLGHRGCV